MNFENTTYFNDSLYGLPYIEESITQLLNNTKYLTKSEQQQLIRCCFFAACAHDGQKRRSGEPYICHPIKVAEILAKEVQFDLPVLEAAVLHDVIEDTSTEKSAIIEAFSNEVADLVDGVSKLEKDKDVTPAELQARTFAKLVVAMEADPRVVMIKFADRMHNMQTLGALRPEKRKRIAQETLEVYVPIAHRLGMFVFKTALEDLAFEHIYPWRYNAVKEAVNASHDKRVDAFNAIKNKLTQQFEELDIKARIRKRRRSTYDVYKKMVRKRSAHHTIERASIPLIIITETIDECYRALGVIHELYTPVSKKLADFIALPKANGYQSIHTSVITPDKELINFQIRNQQMHAVSESGIIAIWKEHNISKKTTIKTIPSRQDKSMRRWLGNMKKLHTLTIDPIIFYETIKRDLGNFDIQALTPKGDPIPLPLGATVIDFAYCIHTQLGNHLSAATVNGVDVALDFKLSHGQTVELFTSPTATPQSYWLKVIRTERARTTIRHFLRSLSTEALAKIGLDEITRYLSEKNESISNLEEKLQQIAQTHNTTQDLLLHNIALREVDLASIYTDLLSLLHKDGTKAKISASVSNKPGALAAIADTIATNHANLLRIDFPNDMQAEEVAITFTVHVENVEQLHQIIGELVRQPLIQNAKYEVPQ